MDVIDMVGWALIGVAMIGLVIGGLMDQMSRLDEIRMKLLVGMEQHLEEATQAHAEVRRGVRTPRLLEVLTLMVCGWSIYLMMCFLGPPKRARMR